MTQVLIINAILVLVFMTLAFKVSWFRKRLDTVDPAWGLAFVLVAWAVVAQQPSKRSLLIAILVSVWGVRLALHLGKRSKNNKEDRRYQELSAKWQGNFWLRAYLSIFLLQGVLVWIVSFPVAFAAGNQLEGLAWLSVAGTVVWAVGFIFEAVADQQLANFVADKNHPKVMRTGLWRYSRHPNYFGELTQWWGIGIIALQTSFGWLGLIGPAVLTILIVFVSGIPPIEKRRVKDPEYRDYQKRTSSIIPLPPRV
ncbi:MAG TPA: DUF1295 domain-containing protein [Methylomirabilota bacterium]|nr:DUF1295 domain-containing protein [Methylomirabilota bacterium]